ncbi:hypothetical protein [Terrabacter terrigena]|uniref:Uncharacterized protein n=1 Tax=Terrabacter terrigena TaxID=574718 RepID=A0ABW3N2Z7_9MICO
MDVADPPPAEQSGSDPAASPDPAAPATGPAARRAPSVKDPGPASAPSQSAGPEPGRSGIWRSEGAKIAVIGAVATALATALFTSNHLDAWFGWGPGPAGATVAASATGQPPSASPSRTAKPVSDRSHAVTVMVPSDWGAGNARYNMPIAGVIDAGSAVRSGKGAGMTTSSSFDEPSVFLGASVEAARRLDLAAHGRADYTTYVKSLLAADDYTVDGCSYGGQQALDKAGYVALVDTWSDCHGFSNTEFRNMYAITEDGSVFVVGQAVTIGADKASGAAILASFAIRPDAVREGEATPSKEMRYPLPPWVTPTSGDVVLP